MTREILHADLLGRNSFGVAATADRIVEFSDAASLRDYLAAHEDIRQGKLGVLGGGNNILFTEDFHGTLLHPAGEGFSVTGSSGNSVSVRAEAGLDWEKFVERCIGLGLWGTENLTAIPGTVGAAPVQNIGAYGAEAKDIVESVETLDLATLKEVSIAGCHCGFGYRDSIFKGVLKGRAVITAVTFRLSRTPRPNLGYDALAREVEDAGGATLENIRTAVRQIRGEKLPDPAVTGNAGSFFKNPVVDGELAERIKRKYPDMPSYPVPEGEDTGRLADRKDRLERSLAGPGRRLRQTGAHPRESGRSNGQRGHGAGPTDNRRRGDPVRYPNSDRSEHMVTEADGTETQCPRNDRNEAGGRKRRRNHTELCSKRNFKGISENTRWWNRTTGYCSPSAEAWIRWS